MRMSMDSLVVSAIILVLSGALVAGSIGWVGLGGGRGSLRLRVLSQDGVPLSGARVRLYGLVPPGLGAPRMVFDGATDGYGFVSIDPSRIRGVAGLWADWLGGNSGVRVALIGMLLYVRGGKAYLKPVSITYDPVEVLRGRGYESVVRIDLRRPTYTRVVGGGSSGVEPQDITGTVTPPFTWSCDNYYCFWADRWWFYPEDGLTKVPLIWVDALGAAGHVYGHIRSEMFYLGAQGGVWSFEAGVFHLVGLSFEAGPPTLEAPTIYYGFSSLDWGIGVLEGYVYLLGQVGLVKWDVGFWNGSGWDIIDVVYEDFLSIVATDGNEVRFGYVEDALPPGVGYLFLNHTISYYDTVSGGEQKLISSRDLGSSYLSTPELQVALPIGALLEVFLGSSIPLAAAVLSALDVLVSYTRVSYAVWLSISEAGVRHIAGTDSVDVYVVESEVEYGINGVQGFHLPVFGLYLYASGGGGCFSGDTLVLTPGGPVRIDSLSRGDLVLFGYGGGMGYARVVEVRRARAARALRINGWLTVSPEQPLLVMEGNGSVTVRRAWMLEVGDTLLGPNGSAVRVESISLVNEPQTLYSLVTTSGRYVVVGPGGVEVTATVK